LIKSILLHADKAAMQALADEFNEAGDHDTAMALSGRIVAPEGKVNAKAAYHATLQVKIAREAAAESARQANLTKLSVLHEPLQKAVTEALHDEPVPGVEGVTYRVHASACGNSAVARISVSLSNGTDREIEARTTLLDGSPKVTISMSTQYMRSGRARQFADWRSAFEYVLQLVVD
jgi:hypothetical protein